MVARRLEVVASGHRGDLATATAHLADPDPSVRAAALAACARAGGWNAEIAAMGAADADELVRTRAYELCGPGDLGASQLSPGLEASDPLCVVACCAAMGRSGDAAGCDALVEVAHHHDPRCQEAAVAALGELGDARGLPAVLAACEGKPALRRRAAVALAGFEGAEVEAALDRLAEDRDWQVRDVVTRLRRDPMPG